MSSDEAAKYGFVRNIHSGPIELGFNLFPNSVVVKLLLQYVGLDIVVKESSFEYLFARGAKIPRYAIFKAEFPVGELKSSQINLWKRLRKALKKEIDTVNDEIALYKKMFSPVPLLSPRHLQARHPAVGKLFLCNRDGALAFNRTTSSGGNWCELEWVGVSTSHFLRPFFRDGKNKIKIRFYHNGTARSPDVTSDFFLEYLKYQLLPTSANHPQVTPKD